MSQIYEREIDQRFAPVVEHVIARADLKPGETALDLGTGTVRLLSEPPLLLLRRAE